MLQWRVQRKFLVTYVDLTKSTEQILILFSYKPEELNLHIMLSTCPRAPFPSSDGFSEIRYTTKTLESRCFIDPITC